MEQEKKIQNYQKVIENLENFFEKYNQDDFGLDKMARYTIVSAAINNEFKEFNFVGFYTVEKKDKGEILEIGPYQSDILATAHIQFGKGVCGTCWEKKETIIINDVNECNNYIACDGVTKAEICVPIFKSDGEMIALLDIDSLVQDFFTKTDKDNLEKIVKFIVK